MQLMQAEAIPFPRSDLPREEIACPSPVPDPVPAARVCETQASGAQSRITNLGPQHEADLLDLLLGLDDPSRRARFDYVPTDASLVEYAKRVVSTADFVAGAFIEGRLRAVAEAFDYDGFSELAFVVHQDWRRHGLGLALLEAAKRWAEQSNRTTLRLIISRGNWPMRTLADKVGARLDVRLDEIYADIAVTGTSGGTTSPNSENEGGVIGWGGQSW
jgi:GNAT superfamily N-acetyltransferase